MFKWQLGWIPLLAALAGGPLVAQPQITGLGTCSNSTLNGTYEMTFGTRQLTNGTFGNVQEEIGTAAFDGNGNVTFNLSINSNQGSSTNNSTGTYTLNGNCTGTLTSNSIAFSLAVWTLGSNSVAASFNITGENGSQIINGNGATITTGCSGSGADSFVINAIGDALSGTTVTGVAALSGIFVTDGNGNITATWTVTSGTTTSTINSKGQYSLGSSCQGNVTLLDSTNNVTYLITFIVFGNGNNFDFIASSPSLIFSGSGHITT